ncbi:hypothetical protein [Cupriavidus basilensis]
MHRTSRLFAGFTATLLRRLFIFFLHVGIFFILLAALLHRRAAFRQRAAATVASWPVLGSAVNTADRAAQTAARLHAETANEWAARVARLVNEGDLEAAATAAYVVGRYGAELPPAVAAHASLKAAYERGMADTKQDAAERGATRVLVPMTR